jgi:multidrug resistance efflux pump
MSSTMEDTDAEASTTPAARSTVNRGGLVVLALVFLSLVLYLLGDRLTPYTSQARVQGYVVGVAPKVGGVVTQVWATNNQLVRDGERLFEIDPSQFQIALRKAQADLEGAKRQIAAADAAVDAARARLRVADAGEVRSRQDFTRLTKLHAEDEGTVSVRRLEMSQASLDQAIARVAAAQAAVYQAIELRGGDDEQNAILEAAEAAVAKAKLDVANTVVSASVQGIVTDLRADVGLYAAAGTPVVTLVSLHDVWVSAEFTENNLGHLHVGSPVELLFDAVPGSVYPGEIRSIGIGVSGSQSPAPGTLPTISNDRDWLRQSQRFPVIIGFDVRQYPELKSQLRIGGQVSVIAYGDGHGPMKLLGQLYIRCMSALSYAY